LEEEHEREENTDFVSRWRVSGKVEAEMRVAVLVKSVRIARIRFSESFDQFHVLEMAFEFF
jgi:hypothetical protein